MRALANSRRFKTPAICRKDCKASKASDIVPPMRPCRHTGKMLFLLIAIAICAVGSSIQVDADSSPALARLRFGQSVAQSDFDLDGTVDRARLARDRARVSVEIFLSGSCSDAATLTSPDESTQESADADGNNRESDQIVIALCSALHGLAFPVSHQSPASLASGAGRFPSERSPPPVLI